LGNAVHGPAPRCLHLGRDHALRFDHHGIHALGEEELGCGSVDEAVRDERPAPDGVLSLEHPVVEYADDQGVSSRQHISFTIERAAPFAVVGVSDCGNSMLARSLVG
jgi:ABC-type uncharacterized transport system ATPase subunit